ncbi:DNA kinase/phosphatase Pnk1, partial [Coemansia aciculifera]
MFSGAIFGYNKNLAAALERGPFSKYASELKRILSAATKKYMTQSAGKRSHLDSTDKNVQQKSLDTFFKPKKMRISNGTADAEAQSVQWREFGQTWQGKYGLTTPASKFAAFDLDGTLICTTSGSVHPRDSNDWRFFHPDVPKLLRNIHKQGYKIVIMSNQNGLKPTKKEPGMTVRAKEYRLKISKIAEQLDVP